MTEYAFPREVPYAQNGMTLRDWFAGMALAAQEIEYETPETCANWAYQVADAMMAARNNTTENKGE